MSLVARLFVCVTTEGALYNSLAFYTHNATNFMPLLNNLIDLTINIPALSLF